MKNSQLYFKISGCIPTYQQFSYIKKTEDRNGYKELIITLDHQPILARKGRQPAIARLPLFLFPDPSESLAQLLKVCLPKL